MTLPNLTFFCELEPDALLDLLQDDVIEHLQALNARVSLGILDLTPERAEAVRRLNRAGIPLIAWLLLPKEQGYYFNARNSGLAAARYQDFRAWSDEQGLIWMGVGLDIEPDIHDFSSLYQQPWTTGLRLALRLFDFRQSRRARQEYRKLSAEIRRDGYYLESYQFPLICDERKAHSRILQRIAGVIDAPVDCEVWMIYTSALRPKGAGILASYAPQAQAIGLGVTGGGVNIEGRPLTAPLTWQEFSRDLRLAWYSCNDLYLFSLEGCVRQNYLERLHNFVWDNPMILPEDSRLEIDAWRGTLQSSLWIIGRLPYILLAALAILGIIRWLRRRPRKA